MAFGWACHAVGVWEFAEARFGNRFWGLAVYAGVGLFWLWVEATRDMRTVVHPRHVKFRQDAVQRMVEDGVDVAALTQAALESRLLDAQTEWNRTHANDKVVDPKRYHRDRGRWWWFAMWALWWPVFFLDAACRLVWVNPLRLVGRLLSLFVKATVRPPRPEPLRLPAGPPSPNLAPRTYP